MDRGSSDGQPLLTTNHIRVHISRENKTSSGCCWLGQAPGPREGIKEKVGAGSSHSTDGERGNKGKRFDHAESPRQWRIVKDMDMQPRDTGT